MIETVDNLEKDGPLWRNVYTQKEGKNERVNLQRGKDLVQVYIKKKAMLRFEAVMVKKRNHIYCTTKPIKC